MDLISHSQLTTPLRAYRPVLRIYDPIGSEIGPEANSQLIRIVCVLTGHGLKDPDRAIASVEKPKVLEPKIDLILKEIGL